MKLGLINDDNLRAELDEALHRLEGQYKTLANEMSELRQQIPPKRNLWQTPGNS